MSDKAPTHRRAVRSFVKRAGRLTTSQQRALEELWPTWGIDYAPETLDLDAVFGRAAPRVLEIGFGNGDSLVEMAAGSPETDYLGVEVHEPGVGHCLLCIEAAAITNVRLIMHDAIEVLENQLAPGSLARVNLYFPDPWPKKRHHKRRIVNDTFLELVASRLVAGGTLNIATDWENYAEHIDEALAASPLFSLDEQREHDGSEPLDRPATKFENRGLRLGHRIRDWRFRRA
ncbi:MAG: tRNA (guanosine(46)-N7)-methyltransferase TrmB [Woeseiaceae bacterium]|jgi:tRNA (guanine-N7-)-methyltransferase|nr:tRNA (guanosine(46)-N7)-methyltransferase TrmB [Woeseiaceae bacterium]